MRIAIYTLGCKTNQYESEVIRESFLKKGDRVVAFKEIADLYIINSCVVTKKAEAETRKVVSEALNSNPNASVILAGCYATLNPIFSREHVILYNGRKEGLADFYYGKNGEGNQEIITNFSRRTRAVVKIEEGCNNFCTYCIVPFVKGYAIRSKSEEVILQEIEGFVDNGYKEIVLTATEIGKYGEDTHTTLAELLRKIKKIKGLERLRISSIHPEHINDAFIGEIVSPLVPHLHISLQSGDNGILKMMRRGYTVEDFLRLIDRFRGIDKNFSISTDLIVGFPGETEDAFFHTVEVVREVQFSKVHIFRFSKRPNTAAHFMKEDISESLKKTRANKLKEVADIERREFKKRFMGARVKVLVEEYNDPYYEGFTPYYLRVRFKGDNAEIGSIVSVKIESYDPDYLYGIS